MRALHIASIIVTVAAAQAQTPATLPKTLPELAATLPQLIHAQPRPFDFGPLSEAVTAALAEDPDEAAQAVPILVRELEEQDQDVQYYALAILQTFASQRNGAQLIAPAIAEVTRIIASGNEYTQGMSLMCISSMRTDVPDAVVSTIETLLLSRPKSDRVTIGASETLMVVRPRDESAQTAVLTVMNDPRTSPELRQQLIYATASPFSGSLIVANIVRVANTADDKDIRDAAIAAATQVGPPAISGILVLLNKIAADPSESLQSHRIAAGALRAMNP